MRDSMTNRTWERRAAWLATPAALAAATLVPSSALGAAGPTETPFAPVVQQVLRGDLVMAANSNLLSAGGWRADGQERADVDGDASQLCVGRDFVPAACADNSSSADLAIPSGARVVAARLYVDTTLSTSVQPMRVRLDGPAPGYAYTELNAATPGIPKVAESAGSSVRGSAPMRQAVWDVTDYVRANGPGSYTVADIMYERAGAFLPYASWAIVAAYELDPSTDLATMPPEQQERFAPRAVTWDDGFVLSADGAVDVPVDGYEVRAGEPVFAKAFHVVAHAQHRGADNLLFGGQPLGNNGAPGEPPPPAGVVIGDDPSCNSTTSILDDSICDLGTPVATKAPGPTAYKASRDGRTASSGSGVDMDVTRIPSRYFVPGSTSATLSMRAVGPTPIAAGMLAVSVDLPPGSAPAGATP
jgi:hypothetical protein